MQPWQIHPGDTELIWSESCVFYAERRKKQSPATWCKLSHDHYFSSVLEKHHAELLAKKTSKEKKARKPKSAPPFPTVLLSHFLVLSWGVSKASFDIWHSDLLQPLGNRDPKGILILSLTVKMCVGGERAKENWGMHDSSEPSHDTSMSHGRVLPLCP